MSAGKKDTKQTHCLGYKHLITLKLHFVFLGTHLLDIIFIFYVQSDRVENIKNNLTEEWSQTQKRRERRRSIRLPPYLPFSSEIPTIECFIHQLCRRIARRPGFSHPIRDWGWGCRGCADKDGENLNFLDCFPSPRRQIRGITKFQTELSVTQWIASISWIVRMSWPRMKRECKTYLCREATVLTGDLGHYFFFVSELFTDRFIKIKCQEFIISQINPITFLLVFRIGQSMIRYTAAQRGSSK